MSVLWFNNIPLLLRFISKTKPVGSCWEWTGSKSGGGYGRFGLNSRNELAHRVSLLLFKGVDLRVDRYISQADHLCRNRLCVNPEHLEMVSQTENILRGESPSAIHSKKTHCPKGHEYTPDNIISGTHRHRLCKECTRLRSCERRKKARLERGLYAF